MTVWTTLNLAGLHHWPHANGVRSYLADRHRHLFRVTVSVRVDHDDRHVEFHDLQDIVRTWWGPQPREWGASSCEHIARELCHHLDDVHHLSVDTVDVSEDGECGATVHLNKGR